MDHPAAAAVAEVVDDLVGEPEETVVAAQDVHLEGAPAEQLVHQAELFPAVVSRALWKKHLEHARVLRDAAQHRAGAPGQALAEPGAPRHRQVG